MKRPRKYLPWLVAVFIPLWLIGVAGELLDARRLESEGTAVDGGITSAKWIKGRRGGPQLDCTVAWNYDDRTYTKEFRLPSRLGEAYADNDGRLWANWECEQAGAGDPSKVEFGIS